MITRKRQGAIVAVLAAGALMLTACTGQGSGTTPSGGSSGTAAAFNAAATSVVNPSTKTGGTLKLLAQSDCDSWDPSQTYYGWCLNMQRLMSRTLINYSKVNGTKFTLAPDLATDMGTHNADYTEWKYTLKSGLKFSTGKAITPMDIKYAVERLYAADVLPNGPGFYFTGLIKAPSSYKGPYKSGDLPSSAIETTSNTITFHLNKPFADFNYLLALPTIAPVPYKTEGGANYTGQNYTKMPVSSGPFVISAYTPTKSVTFTRNKYWSQSTDTIRKPLANEIDLTVDSNPSDIDSKLKAGDADAKADRAIGTTLQTQALTSPTLKKQVDDPGGPSTYYYVIPSSVVPNEHCRLAIMYATNKAGLLAASGGAAAGQVAGSFTPPGIPGYDPSYNPYPVGSDNTGDITKAKSELAACGKPNGFSTKVAYPSDSETAGKRFTVIKAALAKINISVSPATTTSESYYNTFVGSPSNVKNQGFGLIDAGWGADFPTLYGFYQNIMNGAAIKPAGNSNYGSVNDPTINKVLDDTGTPVTNALGVTVNHAVMATATQLPWAWSKTLWWRSTRMTNVTCNNALGFGAYDWVNVGVSGS
ncbi:ABC transporter substrate-binding protein [Amnibacterium sp.]|uniref:ABC transporter substrate-binding protein n=1 Tax=Amnibacterium sp. TaxID=1872496 RepID=UPI003F7CAF15